MATQQLMSSAWSTEGGIRCPSIIAYPGFGNDANGVIKHEMTTVMDILPTLVRGLLFSPSMSLTFQLDLAGVKPPGSNFRGRQVLEPRGKSWVKWLSGSDPEVHDGNAVHGWERKRAHPSMDISDDLVFGQAAIRQGKWKAVWLPPPTGNDKWLLYDISAGQYP